MPVIGALQVAELMLPDRTRLTLETLASRWFLGVHGVVFPGHGSELFALPLPPGTGENEAWGAWLMLCESWKAKGPLAEGSR